MATVGIDLGTTHSLICAWRDEAPHIIPNVLGRHLTPSVVGLDDDGAVLVGQAAKERLISHPHLSAALFKRYMGSGKTLTLGERRFRPEELSGLVLKSLKADAEAFLGEPVMEAVISVPAYFSDAQRKATHHAGALAGLTVKRLINEPTAAALAYGLHRLDTESRFLVFDLGGGTFDVSILELFEGIMEVRASSGDNFLGGEDFNQVIEQAFLKAHDLDPAELDAVTLSRLRNQVERAKQSLSAAPSTQLKLRIHDAEHALTLDREQFAQLSEALLQRLRRPIERALRDAALAPSELDAVVLVGGSSRMHIIRKLAGRMFQRLPHSDINPDEAVALGACIQAALAARDDALKEVVLTDVCPYTLGIEVVKTGRGTFQSGRFHPIIERNTIVPISREERFHTLHDNQEEISVKIFQGESRLVKHNIALGSIDIAVPPDAAGAQGVDVRFSYDINGILQVDVHAPGSGERKSSIINNRGDVLTQEEIRASLAKLEKLKIHPRDQMENRTLIARAERLYEDAVGEAREWVGDQVNAFEHVLDRQDPQEIKRARSALSERLDQFEMQGGLL